MKVDLDSVFARRTIVVSVFASSLLFGGAARLRAHDDCQKRVEKADHRLHQDAAHHGWDSPQAARDREELNQARSYCWDHTHRWWSEDDHRWHSERDWKDHDHDHSQQ